LFVVEDSESYLYLIQNAFSGRQEEIRWELTVATDGEEAFRLLFEEEEKDVPLPDLILLDWNLSKMSGNEVLRRVKGRHKLRRIPVLVFSSSETDEDIYAAYGDRANGYITKPRDVDLLAAIVKSIKNSGLP